MKTAIFTVGLLLTIAMAAAPTANAQLVDPDCVAVQEGSGTFHVLVCGNGVSTVAAREQSSAVAWTIATDMGSQNCYWPPNGAAICDGPTPGATPGSIATITVEVFGPGPVVFSAQTVAT